MNGSAVVLGVTFYFETFELDELLDSLAQLPPELQPTIFGHDEGVKDSKNSLSNGILFRHFVEKSPSGFFLYAKQAMYSLTLRKKTKNLYVEGVSSSEALMLLRSIGTRGVPFAYAAEHAEFEHRNRVIKKIENGTYEAWVGRDWRKYIPGVYWSVVIREDLASQHDVPLRILQDSAASVENLSGGRKLLRFFDKPEDWQRNAARLDELCATTQGIFSIARVKPAFESANSLSETQAALSIWK